MRVAWVALGGAVGSVLRYVLAGVVQGGLMSFPLGTLFVNALGCLAIGFLSERFIAVAVGREIQLAVLVGLLGGFTTFSTFSLETLRLAESRQFVWMSVNIIGTLVGCLAAVWIGQRLAKWMVLP